MAKTVSRTFVALIGFSLAVGVILYLGFQSRNLTLSRQSQNNALIQNFQSLLLVQETASLLRDIELHYRDYITTGSQTHLRHIDNLKTQTAEAFARLRGLNPEADLVSLLDRLQSLHQRQLFGIQSRIENPLQALNPSENEAGITLLDDLRDLVLVIHTHIQQDLDALVQESSVKRHREGLIDLAGNIAAFIFLFIAIYALTREIDWRGHFENLAHLRHNLLLKAREELKMVAAKQGHFEENEKKLSLYTQQLKDRNRDLQQFAQMASENLNDPAQEISRTSSELNEKYRERFDEDGQKSLDGIVAGATRMTGVLSHLREYSRLDGGVNPMVPLNLDLTLKSVLFDLRELIEKTGGRVESLELGEIDGEPGQINQLLKQLVSNALHYHRQGIAPVLKISAETVEQPYRDGDGRETKYQVRRLRFADNGVGFDIKARDRIFEPFQKLPTWHGYTSSGMGLTLVKRIVQRHQGRIDVSSEVDKGSVFTVDLPLNQDSLPQLKDLARQETKSPAAPIDESPDISGGSPLPGPLPPAQLSQPAPPHKDQSNQKPEAKAEPEALSIDSKVPPPAPPAKAQNPTARAKEIPLTDLEKAAREEGIRKRKEARLAKKKRNAELLKEARSKAGENSEDPKPR